jgi:hypothetical protein
MRFDLRTMFATVTLVAIACAAVATIHGCYYVQLRTVNAVLDGYPEIDRVWLATNDDVTLEVEELYFSTRAEPEVIYAVQWIDGASKTTIRSRIDEALRTRESVELPVYVKEYPR